MYDEYDVLQRNDEDCRKSGFRCEVCATPRQEIQHKRRLGYYNVDEGDSLYALVGECRI